MGAMKQMTVILVAKKNINTRVLLKYPAKLASTAFRSLESLLNIRPKGTLSKN
jgi:hypothetical protein